MTEPLDYIDHSSFSRFQSQTLLYFPSKLYRPRQHSRPNTNNWDYSFNLYVLISNRTSQSKKYPIGYILEDTGNFSAKLAKIVNSREEDVNFTYGTTDYPISSSILQTMLHKLAIKTYFLIWTMS